MVYRYTTLVFLLFICSQVFAQKDLLQSGPMVGYSTMREVVLWAQTTEPAEVSFEFWDETAPDNRMVTEKAMTVKDHGYTAHITIDGLEPGKAYNYELVINGEKVEIDYVETVDPITLEKVNKFGSEVLIAAAIIIGKTRLIDNTIVKVEE